MARRDLGRFGERLARLYLAGKGYRVLAAGWRAGRLGEIDLVVRRGEVLAFVEVKTRAGAKYGSPEESISGRKQERLTRLAEAYLGSLAPGSPLRRLRCRFDVVAVERGGPVGWRLRHLPGAFDGAVSGWRRRRPPA